MSFLLLAIIANLFLKILGYKYACVCIHIHRCMNIYIKHAGICMNICEYVY